VGHFGIFVVSNAGVVPPLFVNHLYQGLFGMRAEVAHRYCLRLLLSGRLDVEYFLVLIPCEWVTVKLYLVRTQFPFGRCGAHLELRLTVLLSLHICD
jgi:hypothetical protein